MADDLNSNISILEKELKHHTKASESYIHVKFTYVETGSEWDGWVPTEYRRTGVMVETQEELINRLNYVYDKMNPALLPAWLVEQEDYWANEKKSAAVTKPFYDSLIKGGWQCVECTLPKNPNWARRIQDLKEMGYTLATDTKHYCPNCKANKTHIMLLPIPRGGEGNGYETWSPTLRKRIIKLLNSIDVYENAFNANCLPDHKFSEIRWDENTLTENPNDMTDEQIREKFQLLTNQRNQQKREVCRTCYQTDKRGTIYGIPFYYEGSDEWNTSIPRKGKAAEVGCVGCPWYDIERWRKELLKVLNQNTDEK